MNKDFNLFISQLQETNQTLDFFCDFDKISANVAHGVPQEAEAGRLDLGVRNLSQHLFRGASDDGAGF
jgi:hypothetical protein